MTRKQQPAALPKLAVVELERLAALQEFIGLQRLQQVLDDTGRRNRSHCRLTHAVMLWLVLAMGLLTALPLREVFRYAVRWRLGLKLPGRAASTTAGDWSVSTAWCWMCPTRPPTPACSVG